MFKTHITMVVDRSGSMGQIKVEAESGINAFIDEQKALDGDCTFSLYEFDSGFRKVYDGDIQDMQRYRMTTSGMTDLYGAVCRAVDETGAFLRDMPAAERPEKVAFIVMTDGQQTVWGEFTQDDAKRRIEHQQEKYSWDVSFMGAGLEVASQALSLGFAASHTHNFAAGSGVAVANAYNAHSHSIGMLRSTGRTTYAAATAADGTVIQGDADRTSIQDA